MLQKKCRAQGAALKAWDFGKKRLLTEWLHWV